MGKLNSVDKGLNFIHLSFEDKEIQTGKELTGIISITYEGRFDSISINSLIENSSDIFSYIEVDGKKVNHPYARLSLMKKELLDQNNIRFKVITRHIPTNDISVVKFRVTLIQEHKEIASDVKFIQIKK